MTLQDFVHEVIKQVKNGVVDFNKENEYAKAEVPEVIEMDIAVTTQYNSEVMIATKDDINIARIKITVPTTYSRYPRDK